MIARRPWLVVAPLWLAPGAAQAQDAGGGTVGNLLLCGILALLLAASCAAAVVLWRLWQRTRAETALLADAFGADTRPAMVMRRDGTVVAANRAWHDGYGYDGADPLYVIRGRLADPADAVRLFLAAQSGEPADAELLASGGTSRPRRLTTEPVAAGPGHALWRIEEPIADAGPGLPVEEEIERLIAFSECPDIGVYVADAEGTFLKVNDMLAGWLGDDEAALVAGGKRLTDVLRPANGADRRACLPEPGATEAGTGDGHLVGRDGEEIAVAVSSIGVPAINGTGTLVRGFVRRLPAVAKAPRSDGADLPLGGIFERAPYGIAVVDLLGRIIDANPAFAGLAGGAADALIGAFLKDLIAEDDRDRVREWHAGLIRDTGSADPISARFDGDGDAMSRLTAVRHGGDGVPAMFVIYALDAAGQGEIEPETLHTQKMELVGQLAGGVAHDFNNLLTAMIGFCDLLLLRHSPKDHSFADIMQIKQNANRAANLVRQLLAFSRRLTLQPKVLDLTDVLAELSHLLRRLVGAPIELNMVHGRDLGLVKVDQGQFEQVIINLAVNARDAMVDGGTLTIRTQKVLAGDPRLAEHEDLPDTDCVVIEVSDTGTGIPARLLDKIYEPFFTTKEVGSGTGLGLSTVYGIIKQTGGHIAVSSTEGVGTTFTILLPGIHPDEDAAELRAAAAADRRRDLTGTGTVLLVEDEDAVRLFGARALRNKGYDVIEAANGEGAIEILEAGEHDIDLLITDVVMPGLDGPALIRRVRETHPDLKVIFISGYTEDTFRKRLDDGAVVHFLPKPFSLQQLAGKVKEVMHDEEEVG